MKRIQKNGQTSLHQVMQAVGTLMSENGFALEQTDALSTLIAAEPSVETTLTFTATTGVNPRDNGNEDYVICFQIHGDYIKVQACTPTQIDPSTDKPIDDSRGLMSGNMGWNFKHSKTNLVTRLVGDVIGEYRNSLVQETSRNLSGDGEWFKLPADVNLRATPLSFAAAVTDHGMSLALWIEGDNDEGDINHLSWFTVQHLVDQQSGDTLNSDASRNPVFCLYGISNGENTLNTMIQDAITNWGAEDLSSDTLSYNIIYDQFGRNSLMGSVWVEAGVRDSGGNYTAKVKGTGTDFTRQVLSGDQFVVDGRLLTVISVQTKTEMLADGYYADAPRSYANVVQALGNSADPKTAFLTRPVSCPSLLPNGSPRVGTCQTRYLKTITDPDGNEYPIIVERNKCEIGTAEECIADSVSNTWAPSESVDFTDKFGQLIDPRVTIKRFVVRESDVNRPSQQVDATNNYPASAALVNLKEQQSRVEFRDFSTASVEKLGSKYAILFPNKLSTARFRYKHEMDAVAYTSSSVTSAGLNVHLNVYSESAADHDAGVAYAEGDVVVSGGKLYRADAAVAAGAFNVAEWTEVQDVANNEDRKLYRQFLTLPSMGLDSRNVTVMLLQKDKIARSEFN